MLLRLPCQKPRSGQKLGADEPRSVGFGLAGVLALCQSRLWPPESVKECERAPIGTELELQSIQWGRDPEMAKEQLERTAVV